MSVYANKIVTDHRKAAKKAAAIGAAIGDRMPLDSEWYEFSVASKYMLDCQSMASFIPGLEDALRAEQNAIFNLAHATDEEGVQYSKDATRKAQAAIRKAVAGY